MSFVKRIAAKGNLPIYLVWGKNHRGIDYHWVVASPKMEKEITGSAEPTKLKLKELGTVILKGLGHKLSEEDKAHIYDKYQYDL